MSLAFMKMRHGFWMPLAALLVIGMLSYGLVDAAQMGGADENNLFLSDHGTRVAAFSSEFGSGWEASNLTPSKSDLKPENGIVRPLIWSSASSAPFPHWLLFEFPKRQWITHLVFDNYLADEADHPGISTRDIEVWVGDDPKTLKRAARFTLARNQSDQAIRMEPVETRYIKLVITSNYGHPWYTELNASRAYDDGSRPGSLEDALRKRGSVDLYGLYFDFGSARLRAESAPVLDEIVRYSKAHPEQSLVLEGHTDAVGDDKSNLVLSQERAAAVKNALIKKGVPAGRISSTGFGEGKPVASNETNQGRATNRRVTLRVIAPSAGARPQAAMPGPALGSRILAGDAGAPVSAVVGTGGAIQIAHCDAADAARPPSLGACA